MCHDPAVVRCEERFRLLLRYALPVSDYAQANGLFSQARGHHDLLDAAERRADVAKIRCEAAREALRKHREEHGC
jgi:hypothetical protein